MVLHKWFLAIVLCLSSHCFAAGLEEAQAALGRKDFATTIRLLRQPAEDNDVRAQAILAFVLGYAPDNALRDLAEAAKWARRAADQGSTIGQTLLGIAYLNGRGLPEDTDAAIALLRAAAASSKDNSLAKYEFGKILLVGRGLPVDVSQGESLMRAGVVGIADLKENLDLILEQKSAIAEWRLGVTRLTCGLGCSGTMGSNRRKLKSAADDQLWLEVAARVLHIGYENDLAYFYLGRAAEGVGSLEVATTYYKLAIEKKSQGRACKSSIFNNCDGFDFPRDALERLTYVREEQVKLVGLEQQRKAVFLEKKRGADAVAAAAEEERHRADVAATVEDLARNAERGSADSAYVLSQLYLSGKDVPIDERASASWLTKAAQGGLMVAQYELAERYRIGRNVPLDERRAESWYAKAAAQGDERSQTALLSIQSARQERAAADAAAAADALRRRQVERAELERRKKEENVVKLKSL